MLKLANSLFVVKSAFVLQVLRYMLADRLKMVKMIKMVDALLRLNKVSDELYIVNCKIKIWENLKWLQFKEFSCCKSWNDEMLVWFYSFQEEFWPGVTFCWNFWGEKSPIRQFGAACDQPNLKPLSTNAQDFFFISIIWHWGAVFFVKIQNDGT